MHGKTGLLDRLTRYLGAGLWPLSLFLAAYFAISIAARLILPNSLTLDEAEQALFSQYWLAGYGPQPPFYNWVQNAFVSVMGMSLFTLILPKFTMLLLAFVFFAMAVRELDSRPGFIAMATLALFTLPQVSYMPQQDLTHTIAVLMATSLFFYGLFRILQRSDWQGYAVLGIAIGIGTISKYNFVILPAATILAVFMDRGWRPKLFDLRVLITAAISLLIVLPHVLWLLGNIELATSGTIGKMVEANAPQGLARIGRALGSLVLACVAFGALSAVILGIAYKPNPRTFLRAGDRWTRLLGTIMLLSLCGVVIVIMIAGTTKITERWLDPYLLVFPLYLLLKFERSMTDVSGTLRRFMPVFLALMLITVAIQPVKTFSSGLTGGYSRLNYPFSEMSGAIRSEIRPALIVADGMHLAGNMRMQFPDVPVIDAGKPVPGFPRPEDLTSPVLVIWTATSQPKTAPPVDLSSVQPLNLSPSPVKQLSLPYVYGDGGKQLALEYLWLR